MQQAKTKKPITIITVTYNSSKQIVKLLKSLETSKNNKLINAVIVIENNSPDKNKTADLVRAYQKISTMNINFVMSARNIGFAKSCNLGGNKARSEYILFLNPDTEVLANSIKTLLSHTQINNADISGGKSVNYKNERHLTVVRQPNVNIGLFEFSNLGKLFNTSRGHNDFYYLDQSKILQDKNDVEVDALGGAYLLVRRSSFIKLEGFDEKFFMYLEDVDLSVRAKQLGMKVMYCPHSIIKHIGGASSTNKYRIRHSAWFKSRKYYFRKHYGTLINILIQPLYIFEEIILKFVKGL